MYCESDASGCLDLLAIVIESPAHDRLSSVLVCGGGRGGKGVRNIIELIIVSPVWAAGDGVSRYSRWRLKDEVALRFQEEEWTESALEEGREVLKDVLCYF